MFHQILQLMCSSRLSHLIHNLSECLIYITTLWIRALTPRLENTASIYVHEVMLLVLSRTSVDNKGS